ncbi:MAG TPA: bile acid:sodium symporter [Oceanospirillales bacterium]|nr:bile acid:sodium symporter [Oleispira sp.]HCM05194.1 bile acid:sodium symporter [Oceanospirillales bacterium]|tara:strand:- start:6140 stop:7114 length:975 start_codon:yes stop_codon:yes gene_type:complete
MLSISRLFPILAIVVSFLAYYDPSPLIGWKSSIIPLLALVMFCMGLTLRVTDFKRVWNNPQPIALAIIIQFTVMPLTAVLLSKAFNLSDDFTIGMLIIGACAGGTASNVMTFLARGDVALSVSMTLTSTLWGVVATPWIISITAGEMVQVDSFSILFSIIKMVLIPIAAGVLITHYQPAFTNKVNKYLADIASGIILLIIAIIVALNADEIATVGYAVFAAVALHNIIGLVSGYVAGKLTKQTEVTCRTLAIEVGMQNSGLGVALALKYFGPMAALPGAIFSIFHNISGSVIAGLWRFQTDMKIRAVETQRKGQVKAFDPSKDL